MLVHFNNLQIAGGKLDLTGLDNAGIVTLRFRGESGGQSADYYNDLLVDNICISVASSWDCSSVDLREQVKVHIYIY